MATLKCGVCGFELSRIDLMCPKCNAAVSRRPAPAPAPAPTPSVDDDADERPQRPPPQRRCPSSDCGMPVDDQATSCPYCLRELDTLDTPPDAPEAAGDDAQSPSATSSPLPAALAARFPQVEPLPASGAEADLFIVEDEAGRRFMLKLYRLGVELDEQVLRTLSEADIAHVVHIEEHGRVEGRSFELLEYLAAGDLVRFQQRHGPQLDEELVRLVLKELADAIEHLHGLGVKHGDLKPGNVLVRSEEPEFDLVLTDFGLAAMTDATIAFGGDQRRSLRYSAPEQVGGAHGRPPDVWALGVITMELLLGRHPLEDIADATIDYHLLYQPWPIPYDAVEDPRWQQLFRGVLHRQPEHRWTIGTVQDWLAGRPVDDVPDPAAPEHRARPFRFLGEDYTTTPAVARALVANWEQATARVQHVRAWVAQNEDDPALVAWLDDLDRGPYDRHGRLLRTALRLDPELPPVYRGFDVGPEGLRGLTAAAVVGGPGSREAEVVTSILDQDAFGAIAELTGSPMHRAIAEVIGPAQQQLEQLLRTVASEDLDVDQDTRALARLRLVQLLVDPDELQRVAAEVRTHDDEDLPRWYRELLAEDAGPAELVVARALLTPMLDELAAGRDRRRQQRLRERGASSSAEARTARLSRVGAALLVGALAAFLPMVTVVALAVVAAVDRYGAAIVVWLRRESAVELTRSRAAALPFLALRWVLTGALRLARELVVLAFFTGLAVGVVVAVTAVLGSALPDVVGQPAQLRDRLLLPTIVSVATFVLLRPTPDDRSFPMLRRLGVQLRLAPVGVLLVIIAGGIAAAAATWQLGPAEPHGDLVAFAAPVTDRVADWAERTFETTDTAQPVAQPEPEDAPPDPEPDPEPQHWRVSGAFELNVRAEPGLDSRVLTTLSDGESRPATGRTRQVGDILWIELELADGTTGWASSRYLDAVP